MFYNFKRGYTGMGNHRARYTSIDQCYPGPNILLKNLLSGCYNLNPPKPKYSYSWDPGVVIEFMSNLGRNDYISLPSLARKATIFLALASFLSEASLTQ
jgi:hypothetical protein